MMNLSAGVRRWVPLGLVLVTCSCGTVLDIGGGDGGRDACVVKTCSGLEVWDSLACACVIPKTTCQPPSSCPGGTIFDELQCTCVINPTQPNDGGRDAFTTGDATTDAPSVDECGDYTLSCCVLSSAGCTVSSTFANGDPCSGWTCSNGITPTGGCPPACTPDAGGSDPCAPGTCRFDADAGGACLPPGGPTGPVDSGTLVGCCACGDDGTCSEACICASPDTPIATPDGDREIASLAIGDLVFSIDHGQSVIVPVRETRRSPVTNHRVVEVVLREGPTLRISPVHPTADGRTFGDLRAGDWLGSREVVSATLVPYTHDATYDILPDSETGTYYAGGALIGSTLATHLRQGRANEVCVAQ